MVCLSRYIFVLPVAGLLAGPSGGATAGERIGQLGWRLDGDALMRFGEGLETPHTPWADPWYAGKPKVLFLANGSGAYDVCELARRLPIEVHGFPTLTWFRLGDWYWLWMWLEQSTGSERAATLERMLDDRFDAIVLANFRLASLSETIQYKILRQVADGAGLVMFYQHDFDSRLLQGAVADAPALIANGVPFAGLEFYRNWLMPSRDILTPDRIAPALLQTHTFGQGRVAIVDYNEQSSIFAAAPGAIVPTMEYDYTAEVQYDYHMALAARCLLWAAGREPRLRWTGRFPDGMEIEALSKPQPVRVEAAWSPERGEQLRSGLIRWLRVRNLWGEVLENREDVIVPKGDSLQWDLALPAMPAGRHFVDCMVSSRQGVENWASFAVCVRSPLAIQSIRPAKGFYETSEPVKGQIALSAMTPAGQEVRLDLHLQDCYGRVLAAQTLEVAAGTDRIDFEIPPGQVVSWGARLRASLIVDRQTVHRSEVEVRIRRPSRGEYPIAMWGAIPNYGNHIGNLQMKALGFTAVLSGDPLPQARDDIGWMTFGGGQGAIIHSLGDEIPVPRPAKGEKLNVFLKKRYASLDDLNKAWGTSFAVWEDVEPAYSAVDGDAGSFVRMHDCLSAGEFMFADNIRTRREAIEKVNPPGVVGPEGSEVGDPELTLAEATFWGPYLTVRDNLLVNALGRPGVLRGNWFGGYVEDRRVPTRNRHVLWLSILGGNNMIEYFTIGSGLLAPDLTMMPFTQEFLPSWHQIRLGLGPQLARCRPAGNPVALLHSQPSQHIGEVGGDSTDTIKAHEYLLNLLGDAGYSPQYVSTGQVRQGRLGKGDIKVLFLVHAFALSDEEIKAVRRFAHEGGTVIADIPPAWFDERCRVRPQRAMDDFFGIVQSAPVASMQQRRTLMSTAVSVESRFGPVQLRGRHPEIADAAEGKPASFLGVEHGNGRSMLINGVLWKEGREDPETVQAFRNLLQQFANVQPVFQFSYARPLGKLGTKVYSYQRGDIWIDAILPPEATDPSIPVQITMTWPDRRHTYDLRRSTAVVPDLTESESSALVEPIMGRGGRERGRPEPASADPPLTTQQAIEARMIDTVDLEVERSSPVVVARLPYKVGGITLQVPESARRGDTLEFRAAVHDHDNKPRPGHVIRIEVFGPDKTERPCYGAWLDGDGPEQPGRIPFALNDPPGPWKITATDVISGVSSTETFELTR
ncbi:MAG: hypothetical protein QUV05_01615 [Phycisphaerae bacterium]|nr:hypothetical protein [Phycisphaerae bacterium]